MKIKLRSSSLQNFSCTPMILTNDFLQEKIYKNQVHLGKEEFSDEFYSGFSHAMLVEKKMTEKTFIKSCNVES